MDGLIVPAGHELRCRPGRFVASKTSFEGIHGRKIRSVSRMSIGLTFAVKNGVLSCMNIRVHRRGWARKMKRRPVTSQIQKLEQYGCDAIYVHGEEPMVVEDFVNSLRAKNEAVVCWMAVLAANRRHLQDVLADIHNKDCAVVELETGRRSDNKRDVEAMIFDAVADLAADVRPSKYKAARDGAKGGRPRLDSQETVERARKIWFDVRVKTYEDAAIASGWSWRKMHRYFGPRDPDAKFRGGRRKAAAPKIKTKSKFKRKKKRAQ